MMERTLHLKVKSSELFRFFERRLPQEKFRRVDSAWWEGEDGHGFLLFRRVFWRCMGCATVLIRIEHLADKVSCIRLIGYSNDWLHTGIGDTVVDCVIRAIRRFYSDDCLEQLHEGAWRYLEELGFNITASQWRRKGPPMAYYTLQQYRGVVSVQISRDGCSDLLVQNYARELETLRQYDKLNLGGMLIVGCPEGVLSGPFLTDSKLLTTVKRAGFTLLGFKRLAALVTDVREGRITKLDAQTLLTRPGMIALDPSLAECAATSYKR
jgi:hypothetical protein